MKNTYIISMVKKTIIGLVISLLCQILTTENCIAENTKTLVASFYSIESLKKEGTYKHSKGVMANGDKFNNNAFTCANRLYPLGSLLRVTDVKSDKSIVVRTTDRIGKRFSKTRIDLSIAAMETLAGKQGLLQGLIKVRVERIA